MRLQTKFIQCHAHKSNNTAFYFWAQVIGLIVGLATAMTCAVGWLALEMPQF